MSRYSNYMGDDLEGRTWGDYSPHGTRSYFAPSSILEDDTDDTILDALEASLRADMKAAKQAEKAEAEAKAKGPQEGPQEAVKRGRGRPPGSKNKPKVHYYDGPIA